MKVKSKNVHICEHCGVELTKNDLKNFRIYLRNKFFEFNSEYCEHCNKLAYDWWKSFSSEGERDFRNKMIAMEKVLSKDKVA